MTGTNIVCGVKICTHNDIMRGCKKKKTVILNSYGNCLCKEIETKVEETEEDQEAEERRLIYGV